MATSFNHYLISSDGPDAERSEKKINPSTDVRFAGRDSLPSITMWVDHARAATGIRMTTVERRQLIAALRSRQHLILSGPADIGKRQLAKALAFSMAERQRKRVRLIQGHPWWATGTGDVAHFVNLQMEFSVWRLIDFMESAGNGTRLSSQIQTDRKGGDYVACIERMSPVEIDFYFGVFSQWLRRNRPDKDAALTLRLIGTFDSRKPPNLDRRILCEAAVVHLGSGSAH